MLTRILRLAHVGLFHNGTPTALELRKASLVYAENGRGKSTLSAVLDSCARGRPELITCRSTIDQPGASPAVELIFNTGTARVTFEDGAWSSLRPEILVFDSAFVHENVHTGMAITSENRRGLYEFALGEAAAEVREMERLADEQAAASRLRGERERALLTVAGPYSVRDFVAVQQFPELEERIADARHRLEASRRAAQVLARQDLAPVRAPSVDLAEVFRILRQNLADLNAMAEERVRAHIANHQAPGFEEWVSRGRDFERLNVCPYCGQDTEHVDLLQAYRQFFSEEYGRLREAVAHLREVVAGTVNEAVIQHWSDILEANRARQEAWADLLPVERVDFDLQAAAADVNALLVALMTAVDRKRAALADWFIADEDELQVTNRFAAISGRLETYNHHVEAINATYAARKREVAAGDQAAIAAEISRLEAAQRRFTSPVIEAVDLFTQAEQAAAAATTAKEAMRERHDRTMRETLARYEIAINQRLSSLRTGFRIERLGGRHDAGRPPRATYAIALRGRTISELERIGQGHSLPTALSEGDRRSLALAFFLARLDLDAGLVNRILVFDDPMASFDENRKQETIRALRDLAGKCEQVIVLSHDPHFLREMAALHRRDGRAFIAYKIGYAARDYAQFEDCDLNQLCELPYFKRYLGAWRYLNGENGDGAQQVASDLRVLLEEFYKLRYPHLLAGVETLSGIIRMIRDAAPGSTLAALQPLAIQLEEFDRYASPYHHSNPNYRNEVIQENRLRHFVSGALSLIHDDGRSHPIIP